MSFSSRIQSVFFLSLFAMVAIQTFAVAGQETRDGRPVEQVSCLELSDCEGDVPEIEILSDFDGDSFSKGSQESNESP